MLRRNPHHAAERESEMGRSSRRCGYCARDSGRKSTYDISELVESLEKVFNNLYVPLEYLPSLRDRVAGSGSVDGEVVGMDVQTLETGGVWHVHPARSAGVNQVVATRGCARKALFRMTN